MILELIFRIIQIILGTGWIFIYIWSLSYKQYNVSYLVGAYVFFALLVLAIILSAAEGLKLIKKQPERGAVIGMLWGFGAVPLSVVLFIITLVVSKLRPAQFIG